LGRTGGATAKQKARRESVERKRGHSAAFMSRLKVTHKAHSTTVAENAPRAVSDLCGSCSQCLPDWAKLCRAYAALMGQKSRQVRFQDSGGVHRTPRTGDAGATAEKATSKGKESIFKFQIPNGSVDFHAEVQVSCASEGSFGRIYPAPASRGITKRWQATALQISGGRRRLGCCHSGNNLP